MELAMTDPLAIILAAVLGAAVSCVATIWLNNREWHKRLRQFEQCRTFLLDGKSYSLNEMPWLRPRPAETKLMGSGDIVKSEDKVL